MTFEEARDAICAIFKSAWDVTNYPVKWDDVAGEKATSETPWARVTIRHASGRQSSLTGGLGVRKLTRTGTVFVQIFTPIGDGSKAGYDAAQLAAGAFETAHDPDVWFKNVTMREAGQDGAFNLFNVSATFSYDDVR